MSLLANVEPTTFWPHLSWKAFSELPAKERFLIILPIHGFTDLGSSVPLDAEEIVTSAALRTALEVIKADLPAITMAPLRFTLGAKNKSLFRIDPPLAHQLLREIAFGVQAAGFRKLVFLNSNATSTDLVDAASRDIRADLQLQTFVINTSGIGLPFTANFDGATVVDELTSTETPGATAISRSLVESAAGKLAGLLREISSRGPLGSERSPTRPPFATATPFQLQRGTPFPEIYRKRYLASFSLPQMADWPKAGTWVILPTGAIEQHGHHLPVGVDAILGQAALQATLPLLREQVRVLVAPPLTYTKSNEHVGFPGTIFISADSLRRLLFACVGELKRNGFERILIYNTHGGNTAVLNYTLRELEETFEVRVRMLRSQFVPPLSPQELQYGFHAGQWETALMLAATPELVHMERAVCEYPAHVDDPGELRPENAPATFSWISRDVSKSGVMGDATLASAERGQRWMEDMAASLAAEIERFAVEPT